MIRYDVRGRCDQCELEVDGYVDLALRSTVAPGLDDLSPVEAVAAPIVGLSQKMVFTESGLLFCSVNCEERWAARPARGVEAGVEEADAPAVSTAAVPVLRFAKAAPSTPTAIPTAPPPRPSITLTKGQQEAYDLVLQAKAEPGKMPLVRITGYAGVGKSTLLREILSAIGQTVLLAPTGKAAARIREVTGAPASTIHSWLYAPQEDIRTGEMRFERKPTSDLTRHANRMVIVDEASMISKEVFNDLKLVCEALELTLVLVGDGFQLPPVQELGANFEPMRIETPYAAALTEVMRQAEGNPIIAASMAIRNGRPFEGLKLLHRFGAGEVPQAAFNCWVNGGVAIVHRNTTRTRLNFEMRARAGFADANLVAQPGEPLLVRKNTPALGAFNGEVVKFSKWLSPPSEERLVRDRYKGEEQRLHFGLAELEGGRKAVLCHEELGGWCKVGFAPMAKAIADRWTRLVTVIEDGEVVEKQRPEPLLSAQFGYTFTAHAAQGSQWPFALVVLESSVRLHQEEGLRWAYTAVTRAAENCAYVMGNI